MYRGEVASGTVLANRQPEGLAAEGAVEVGLGQVDAGGGAPVAAGERAQRLQPPGHRRGKALLAAQVGDDQLVDRTAHLHRDCHT